MTRKSSPARSRTTKTVSRATALGTVSGTACILDPIIEAIRPHWKKSLKKLTEDERDAHKETIRDAISRHFGKLSILEAICIHGFLTARMSGGIHDEGSIEYVAMTYGYDILWDWAAVEIKATTTKEYHARLNFLWSEAREGIVQEDQARDAFSSLRLDLDYLDGKAVRPGCDKGHFHSRGWNAVFDQK